MGMWDWMTVFGDILMTRWNTRKHPTQLMGDPDGLRGWTAVVTGATRGIGVFTALELARHGAKVILAVRDMNRSVANNIVQQRSAV